MKTILDLLYVGVQVLRLALSACIVVYMYFFFSDLDKMLTSNLEFALMSLPIFLFWCFAFSALNRIVPVIKQCQKGNYFTKANAHSVQFLAYILIIYGIGSPVLEFIFNIIAHSRFELSYALDLEKSFVSHLALGLILLLMAKIIKRGTSLEEEQKFTI